MGRAGGPERGERRASPRRCSQPRCRAVPKAAGPGQGAVLPRDPVRCVPPGGILSLFLLLPGTPVGDPGQMLGATLGAMFSLRDVTLRVAEAEGTGLRRQAWE